MHTDVMLFFFNLKFIAVYNFNADVTYYSTIPQLMYVLVS